MQEKEDIAIAATVDVVFMDIVNYWRYIHDLYNLLEIFMINKTKLHMTDIFCNCHRCCRNLTIRYYLLIQYYLYIFMMSMATVFYIYYITIEIMYLLRL